MTMIFCAMHIILRLQCSTQQKELVEDKRAPFLRIKYSLHFNKTLPRECLTFVCLRVDWKCHTEQFSRSGINDFSHQRGDCEWSLESVLCIVGVILYKYYWNSWNICRRCVVTTCKHYPDVFLFTQQNNKRLWTSLIISSHIETNMQYTTERARGGQRAPFLRIKYSLLIIIIISDLTISTLLLPHST